MIDNLARTELELTQDFAAAPERVFGAFVDADQFALWFGAIGYHVPRAEVDIDPRVGGALTFVMVSDRDPGKVVKVNATFAQVVANELLVAEDLPEPGDQDDIGLRLLRMEFQAVGEGTRLHVRQGPYTRKGAERARKGWEGSFTKLDEMLGR
jgi:uncharacterized protein YndB with AHSA1/START domain